MCPDSPSQLPSSTRAIPKRVSSDKFQGRPLHSSPARITRLGVRRSRRQDRATAWIDELNEFRLDWGSLSSRRHGGHQVIPRSLPRDDVDELVARNGCRGYASSLRQPLPSDVSGKHLRKRTMIASVTHTPVGAASGRGRECSPNRNECPSQH